MTTCVITYDIDPNRPGLFAEYARNRGHCGADLIGYFARTRVRPPPPMASIRCPPWRNTRPIGPGWRPIR